MDYDNSRKVEQGSEQPIQSAPLSSSEKPGNFRTQMCGAWAAQLVCAQNDVLKTGVKISQNYTDQQLLAYQSQSACMKASLTQSYSAADKGAEALRIQAGNSFLSAGVTGGSIAFMARAPRASESNWTSSANGRKLGNLNDQMQQLHAMKSQALKPAAPNSATVRAQTPGAPLAPREQLIADRKTELLNDPIVARRLKETNPVNSNPSSENAAFRQNEYNQKAGHFYRDGADNQELHAKRCATGERTDGAFHFEGLDDEAIGSMTPAQKQAFIKKLDAKIDSVQTQINGAEGKIQSDYTMIQQVTSMVNAGVDGSFKSLQAGADAESKKEEAVSAVSNRLMEMASTLAQALAQARANDIDNTMKTVDAFNGDRKSVV